MIKVYFVLKDKFNNLLLYICIIYNFFFFEGYRRFYNYVSDIFISSIVEVIVWIFRC